jgi:uncharacterized membrane protein
MLLVMLAITVLTSLAAVAIVGHNQSAFVGSQPNRAARSTSPVDQAERILAHRYAKGEITADEYRRMLSILRRSPPAPNTFPLLVRSDPVWQNRVASYLE